MAAALFLQLPRLSVRIADKQIGKQILCGCRYRRRLRRGLPRVGAAKGMQQAKAIRFRRADGANVFRHFARRRRRSHERSHARGKVGFHRLAQSRGGRAVGGPEAGGCAGMRRLFVGQGVAPTDAAGSRRGVAAGLPRADGRIPPDAAVPPDVVGARTRIRRRSLDGGDLGLARRRGRHGRGGRRVVELEFGPALAVVGPAHAQEEVVLVVDQEDQDVLGQLVCARSHLVARVRDQAGLEDGGKVFGIHPVQLRFGGKDGQQVQDVEQELAVERGQLGDEPLVDLDGIGSEEFFRLHRQRISESVVEVERNDRFRQLVEVPSQNIRRIMHRVTGPIQTLPVLFGGVKNGLEVLDSLCGAIQSEDTFNVRRYCGVLGLIV